METWKHRGREFVVIRLPYEHYANIHLYYRKEYTPSYWNIEHALYLKNNPNTGLLILEEAEVDDLQRKPLVLELTKFYKENNLSNQIYILYQGTGQDSYIEEYLQTVPNYFTFVRSKSAPYNFLMNWAVTHSKVDNPTDLITNTYTKENFLAEFNLEKHFVILAGKSRACRLMFLNSILTNNLLKDSYHSFNNEYLKLDKDVIKKLMDQGYTYRQIINNHHDKSEIDFLKGHNILLSEEEITTIRKTHRDILPLFNLPRKTDDYYYDPWWIFPEPELYKSVAVDIVNETFHHRGIVRNSLFSNINFFTEKITKPILSFRPFMVLANKYYLRDLKAEYGFKSFDKYWDESYDEVGTAKEAINIVTNNMQMLSMKSKEELKDMLIDMKPILIHNANVAKKYLLEKEAWIEDMQKYVEGKRASWSGKKTFTLI